MTEADLLQRISGTELETMRAVLLGDTQGDPVENQIQLTTDFVRGFIAANRENRMGPAGTLPPSLLLLAADICIVDLNTRAGGVLIDDSKQRAKARDTAIDILRADVANGDFAIEDPDTGAHGSATGPAFTKPDRRWTDANQDGI
jgi:hypothetical protein